MFPSVSLANHILHHPLKCSGLVLQRVASIKVNKIQLCAYGSTLDFLLNLIELGLQNNIY